MRYAILSIQRTGSNVLCELLAQTGVAGISDLYDAGLFIGYGDDIADAYARGAIDAYFSRSRTANGVEGCKVGWDYLEHLNAKLPFGAVDAILNSFDRFVLLTRQNEVAQAVSRLIAMRTGEWTSEDHKRLRKDPEPVVYDRERICWYIAEHRAAASALEVWLTLHGIEPLRMTYEDNAQDWQKAVCRVLDFIEVEPPEMALRPTLERQEDPRKAEFIARFLAEEGIWA